MSEVRVVHLHAEPCEHENLGAWQSFNGLWYCVVDDCPGGKQIELTFRNDMSPSEPQNPSEKVISFTPVLQSEEILALHLAGLDAQPFTESWFYDDNDIPSPLLSTRHLLPFLPVLPERTLYERNEETHLWDNVTIARVAHIKNIAIRDFLLTDADWLFLIDSDVVLAPGTLTHMLERRNPILCAVYWTKWKPDGEMESPNVWDQHPAQSNPGRYNELRIPGHYEVGGLGACTLIHRTVLESGVNFLPVTGVGYWGEDRHFSIRAAARDIPLVACSHVDVRHVYRDADIEPTRQWWGEVGEGT